jgi:hypothetical protein
MRQLRCCILLVLVLACERSSPSTRQRIYEKALAELRSSSVPTRAQGARTMVLGCCFENFFDSTTNPGADPFLQKVCAQVRRLLETETEPLVMEKLILPINLSADRPHCYADFPSSIVLGLCQTGCRARARVGLAMMLRALDPSPEIAAALVHQLEVPDDASLVPDPLDLTASEQDIDDAVAVALADAGEPDLGPILAALTSPLPRVRRGATKAIWFAMELRPPLEMPELGAALEELQTDSDPETAEHARAAARLYRSLGKQSPDEHVSWLVNENDKRLAIRMLAVRRFSCRAATAADALAQLSGNADPGIAAAARRAIAFRAQRCRQLGL